MCHFVFVFFSPFSIAITSLGEEKGNLSAFRTFVRFVLVWICRFPLPLSVWEGLRFVIVSLPGLFSYLFFKALLQLANFTLCPDATLHTNTHKKSVRIKAPNSVIASKRKHKNQINHYNKQRRVLMANSTVCQSKRKPIVEPRRAKSKTYRQAQAHWLKFYEEVVIGSDARTAVVQLE